MKVGSRAGSRGEFRADSRGRTRSERIDVCRGARINKESRCWRRDEQSGIVQKLELREGRSRSY
jgi:hypothetical protein